MKSIQYLSASQTIINNNEGLKTLFTGKKISALNFFKANFVQIYQFCQVLVTALGPLSQAPTHQDPKQLRPIILCKLKNILHFFVSNYWGH